jgi:ABC-type lipoprotein export system ATPase subunit
MNRLETIKVADAMHEGVFTCSLHAPLTTVARIMAAHRVHAVVVWNEPARNETAQLWGVVSDLDLIKLPGGLPRSRSGCCPPWIWRRPSPARELPRLRSHIRDWPHSLSAEAPMAQRTPVGIVIATAERGGRHVQRKPRDARRSPQGSGGALMDAASDIPIVEARRLVKTYDTGAVQVRALKGVDLAIRRGEMVSIMGPSGCGKTTLLNCLSGLDAIDGGDVLIEGVSLASMSDRERTDYRAAHMGFVFQFYNLMPVLTAVENVELPLLVARVRAREARERALDALELVGLRARAAHVPDELSGGERQRVTIARSLVNDPAIVWADEPTGDLDSENAAEITDLMRHLNRESGLTFLIVTHDSNVGYSADRMIRMVDGRVVADERIEAGPTAAWAR